MSLAPADYAALVAQANLAPSVHNTQPTRWRLETDGSVLVLEDLARRLPVGDPSGQDARVSHGAAIEGFALACAAEGWAVEATPLDGEQTAGMETALRPVARLTLASGAAADPLQAHVAGRRTYRGAFVRAADPAKLDALAAGGDVRLVRSPQDIAFIAGLNDLGSLRTFRHGPYRAELLSWMRLSRRHPRWALDGLNAEAMEMSAVAAAGAGLVLKPGVFEILDRVGLAAPLTAEAAVVRSAQAVVLFHRPADEDALLTGRRFHRLWLEFTRLGLSAAPMTVLADDAEARSTLARRFELPAGRRLVTAFRVGRAPRDRLDAKPRLSVDELLV